MALEEPAHSLHDDPGLARARTRDDHERAARPLHDLTLRVRQGLRRRLLGPVARGVLRAIPQLQRMHVPIMRATRASSSGTCRGVERPPCCGVQGRDRRRHIAAPRRPRSLTPAPSSRAARADLDSPRGTARSAAQDGRHTTGGGRDENETADRGGDGTERPSELDVRGDA